VSGVQRVPVDDEMCVFTAAARGAGRRGAVGSPRDVRGVAVVS
jgi:hypothetical protein